jgi:very-short-patch-repair endonuclease
MRCESPIEDHLGAALIVEARGEFDVIPQFRLGRYRYDFAITPPGACRPLVLVECDSAAFHATAAQRANDRAKDADAHAVGIRLIRVRGKEIYRNAPALAEFIVGECCR